MDGVEEQASSPCQSRNTNRFVSRTNPLNTRLCTPGQSDVGDLKRLCGMSLEILGVIVVSEVSRRPMGWGNARREALFTLKLV